MTKHLDLIESPTSDFSGVGKGQGTLFLVEFPDSNQYFSSLLRRQNHLNQVNFG